jgi:hypothetical protein
MIRYLSVIEKAQRPDNLPFNLCIDNIGFFKSLRNRDSLRSADNLTDAGNFLYLLTKRDEYKIRMRD